MEINLEFVIKAYSIHTGESITFNLNKCYDENLTLNDILKDLYQQYSQEKVKPEDLQPFGHCALIWGYDFIEFNYKLEGLESENDIYEYLNISIGYLEKKFNITQMQFEIWLDPPIGGTVGRCRGIHFFFHTNEKDIHHRAHIHCKCGREEFRVDLNDLKIIDKPFKNKSRTKKALEIIKINQLELKRYWNDVVVNGEKVKFKMYLPSR